MVLAKGKEKPELAVEAFITSLSSRKLEDAYWLLTSPERATVPLAEWLGKAWDAPDDQLLQDAKNIKILGIEYTANKRQAVVQTMLFLPNEVTVAYNSRLEHDGWHIYLGLERPRGTWSFHWSV